MRESYIGLARITSGHSGPTVPSPSAGERPRTGWLGTLRTTSESAREIAKAGIRRVATNIAAAHSCTADVGIRAGYPVTVNDPGFVDFARAVATEMLGADDWDAMAVGIAMHAVIAHRYLTLPPAS